MAITVSGLFYPTFRDMFINAIAADLNSETDVYIALYNNTVTTPNFDTNTAYNSAPFDANQVTGTGWATGGVTLTTTTFSVASGTLQYQTANVSQPSTTLSAVRGGLVYCLTATSKNAICLVNFVSDYSTNNGTFAITWNAAGIFTIDLTP